MSPLPVRFRLPLLLACVALLVAASELPTVEATCAGPRARQSWGALASKDKTLYRDAISAAMATGNHALFTEVVADLASFNEAYRTCATIFWHRRFLLAYENMLRSLEPRFECVTIPYWDSFTDYVSAIADNTSSLQSKSLFLTEFGGSQGPAVSTSIDGIDVTGNCVAGSSSPYANFTSFCQSSSPGNDSCLGCVPRGSWLAKKFPSGFGYATLARYLSIPAGFSWFSQSVHYGMTYPMYGAMAGAIATYATAAEPMFYNFHATVDMVHQLYFDCQINRTLTTAEKQSPYSKFTYQRCGQTQADLPACPSMTSNMTMYWQAGSAERIRVEDHPRLRPFFSNLPTQYWNYASTYDLGDNAYSYEADNLFRLLTDAGLSCSNGHTRRRLERFVEVPVTESKRTKNVAKTFNLFRDIYKAADDQSASNQEALDQVELTECAYYADQFGAVEDLSPELRATFNIPPSVHPPCYNQLAALHSGRKSIRVPNWKGKYDYHMKMSDAQLSTDGQVAISDGETMEAAT
ncbi:hypothetical protein BBJ28_00015234 [Nothophytophthora sp. Chile5]|nr:hypothetical protein BBJ28_00015234 [Nothophytophthora sp. Chile5]